MADGIVLTGATGFLGTEIALKLVEQSDRKVYVLVRSRDESEASHRLKAAWNNFDKLYEKIGGQIIPIVGDFTKDNLSISQENMELIREKDSNEVDSVVSDENIHIRYLLCFSEYRIF